MSHETSQPQNQPSGEQPTEKTTMQKVCDLFLSKDELRPAMCVPFTIGEYVYATDAHVLVRFPVAALDFEIEPNDYTPPKANTIIEPLLGEDALQFTIKLSELGAVMAQVPDEKVYADCDVCGGSGKSMCPCCENVSKCNECDGSGYDKSEITGTVKKDLRIALRPDFEYAPPRIDKVAFYAPLLNRVLLTADMIGHDTDDIEVRFERPTSAHLFMLGQIIVLVMPMMLFDETEDFKILLSPCQK